MTRGVMASRLDDNSRSEIVDIMVPAGSCRYHISNALVEMAQDLLVEDFEPFLFN